MAEPRLSAVDGWFTADDDAPHLIGLRCDACGTYIFPPRAPACPNPSCDGTDLGEVELSRTGTVWSWTTNHYPPPEPYVAPDPFEPYTVAAVELAAERIVVLGQLAPGVDADDLALGAEVELVLDTLFVDEQGAEHVVWKWRPTAGDR